MLWIEVDVDGLLVIGDDVMDAALTAILGIELQVLDDIAQQHARLQDLYFVVDTGGIGEETQILHASQHLVGILALVLILDEHAGRNLIDGFGIAQVDERSTHEDDE